MRARGLKMTARYQCRFSLTGTMMKSFWKTSTDLVHFLTESYAGHFLSLSGFGLVVSAAATQHLLCVSAGELVVEEGIEEMESCLLTLQHLCHSVAEAKLKGDVVQEVIVHQAVETVLGDVQAASPCEGVREKAGIRIDTAAETHRSCLSKCGDRRRCGRLDWGASSSERVLTVGVAPAMERRVLRLGGAASLGLRKSEIQLLTRLTS